VESISLKNLLGMHISFSLSYLILPPPHTHINAHTVTILLKRELREMPGNSQKAGKICFAKCLSLETKCLFYKEDLRFI
jgi:hypothetical protein